MSETRLLVAGSRKWPRGVVLPGALRRMGDALGANQRDVVMVHGDCPDGADAEAHELWTGWGWPTEPTPAVWSECAPECIRFRQPHRRRNRRGEWYCPAAGMRRNALMVDRGASAMLAFVVLGGSPGTRGCIRLAKDAGIPVWEYRPDGTVIAPFPNTVLQQGTMW